MKTYPLVDLTGDSYLNPVGAAYTDGTGTHQRNESTIRSISVHHDAAQRPHAYDSVARYRNEAAYHYKTLGPGLQYHYKIDNQGTIFKIRPHSTWLYVVGSSENVSCLAICLDGYFHPPYNEKPTREQYEALAQLLTFLCEQQPQFPATWPDVRPHASYTSTACAGSLLNPFIYAINSKADAYKIPADAVYDWPELQPSSVIPPAPVPVDSRPEYEKNFVAIDTKKWVKGSATVIDMTNGRTLSTLADDTVVEIGGKTQYAGTEMFISKYWASRNVHSKGIPGAQLGDTPKPVVIPPTPTVPPPPEVQNDHEIIVDTNEKVSAILAIVQWIKELLSNVFNIGGK